MRFFILVIFALLILVSPSFAFAQTSNCSSGSTLNIVAHEDDDLLFLSPDLLADIRSGRCVTTVYLTAGDANLGSSYWKGREDGVRAAYSQMVGSGSWSNGNVGVGNKRLASSSMKSVTLVFMRLPDGNWDGSGFSNNSNESIKKLWQGNISSVRAVDGSATYSKSELISVLAGLMNNFRPDRIKTQNYVDGYSGEDHSDHFTAAYAAVEARKQYNLANTLTGYLGYATSSRGANVGGSDLTSKRNAFFAYANHDSNVCNSLSACSSSSYGAWLERQYVVGTLNSSPSQTPTPSPTATARPTSTPRSTSTPRPTSTPRGVPTPRPIPTPTPTPTPSSPVLRWTGEVKPSFSERYEFCLEGNGGFRLWVDGEELIDEWDDDTDEECDSIRLSAGKSYLVRVESKSLGTKFYWESRSQAKQIVPNSLLTF